jgi:hypothetical protein
MKTKMFSLLIAVAISSQISAFPLIEKNNEGNVEIEKEKLSERTNILFEMNLDENSGILTVDVAGSFDQYSSVSVTSNRGSEYFFQFVKNEIDQLTFNVSELEKGSYFVVLNTNDEIRIIRFLIN